MTLFPKNYYLETAKLGRLIVNGEFKSAIDFVKEDPIVLSCGLVTSIICGGGCYKIPMWCYPGMLIREGSNEALVGTSCFKDFCRFVVDTMAESHGKERSFFFTYGLIKYALVAGWKDFADEAMEMGILNEDGKDALKSEFSSSPYVKEWGNEFAEFCGM